MVFSLFLLLCHIILDKEKWWCSPSVYHSLLLCCKDLLTNTLTAHPLNVLLWMEDVQYRVWVTVVLGVMVDLYYFLRIIFKFNGSYTWRYLSLVVTVFKLLDSCKLHYHTILCFVAQFTDINIPSSSDKTTCSVKHFTKNNINSCCVNQEFHLYPYQDLTSLLR